MPDSQRRDGNKGRVRKHEHDPGAAEPGSDRTGGGHEAPSIEITFTEEQAYAVKRAVDLANRLKLGQFEELWGYFESELFKRLKGVDEYCANRERARHLLITLKFLFGFPVEHGANGSYGVGSPELTKEDNRLYEVYKVLAKALHEIRKDPKDQHAMWCVDNDDPYLLNFSGDRKIPCAVRWNGQVRFLHIKDLH
jgi:hypothetical protein